MCLNYYANRPKKKGGYRTEVYIAYQLATCALKYIICTAENYPIRENITIRKQFDFFDFFFFLIQNFFLLEKTGWLVLFYFIFGTNKGVPYGAREKDIQKTWRNILGFHACRGSGYGASILDSSSSCRQPLRNSSWVNCPSLFSSILANMFLARSSAESAGRLDEHAPNMS